MPYKTTTLGTEKPSQRTNLKYCCLYITVYRLVHWGVSFTYGIVVWLSVVVRCSWQKTLFWLFYCYQCWWWSWAYLRGALTWFSFNVMYTKFHHFLIFLLEWSIPFWERIDWTKWISDTISCGLFCLQRSFPLVLQFWWFSIDSS